MVIRFWGVRGSIASPALPSDVKKNISEIIHNATPEDLANRESRERFLSSLPPWLYGTVGGNTPCVSVEIEGFDEFIAFDCGSGIREFSADCISKNSKPSKYHIFFSHFHWDHLQGLPFFVPAYDTSVTIDFYSPAQEMESILSKQMTSPFFPIRLENTGAEKKFHVLDSPVSLGPAEITYRKMKHPDDSYSFRIKHNEKICIYATDTELSDSDFLKTPENEEYFKDADLIILDAQYTPDEAVEKYNWGHSAFSFSVDFAANWGIKRLVLFHHDPAYDDKKLYEILQSARRHLQQNNHKGIEVYLAVEGMTISL